MLASFLALVILANHIETLLQLSRQNAFGRLAIPQPKTDPQLIEGPPFWGNSIPFT